MATEVLADAEERMRKTLDAVEREMTSIRTGRARTGLVDQIKADYYGAPTPLSQLATITAPEPRLIVIQPWDRHAVGAIEKAILKADLGLNPVSDGTLIRLPIPQLSEERRREMVKLVHKRAEDGRVAIRNVRRDAADKLRDMEKSKDISEDEHKRLLEQLQGLTGLFVDEVDSLSKAKEAELLEV
ncbi:MAG: ribosome recycling factor [Chloroflexi bacterium]|nr:ribosome recycling factor [Chloroflexota bacterium]